jgi:hypothetical protein
MFAPEKIHDFVPDKIVFGPRKDTKKNAADSPKTQKTLDFFE